MNFKKYAADIKLGLSLFLIIAAWSCAQINNTGSEKKSQPLVLAQSSAIKTDQPKQVKVGKAVPRDAIAGIYTSILNGDFATAKQILNNADISDTKKAQSFQYLLDEYENIKNRRDSLNKEMYKKNYQEYLEIKKKSAPQDVNDIDEAFLALIKTIDYAEPQQKKKILQDDYVTTLTENALTLADKYEKQGKWVESYAHTYYWLNAIFEDNKKYSQKADDLLEMAAIELSIKDNSCETAEQRHEGIEPDMFVKAIKALDFHYVNVVDYEKMLEKAIKRAKLLGKVVTQTQEQLAFKAEPDDDANWQKGLKKLSSPGSETFSVVTRDKFIKIFYQVLKLNQETLKMPDEVVIAQYAESALSALDPHTNLIWPWQVRDFQKNITQKFTGVGIQISKIKGILKVESLIPNTPAYKSGLDADDIITAINGEPVTKEMSIQCAVSKITGPRGTPVTLTVKRADKQKEEDIMIVRDYIIVPTIKGWQREADGNWKYMIDPENKIGYLSISNFTDTTARDMERALKKLEQRGLNGLILDLRYNTGGLLISAADVADMFINVENGLIVKSQPRWGLSSYEEAHAKGTHPNYPLVILINQSSASASEIVAGALQDEKYNRATLVGVRSYGKGSVQTILDHTGGGSKLKYTMAYYHLPSNQRVHDRHEMERQGRKDWGIAPDVEVKLTPEESKQMREVQNENETLARADHDYELTPINRHSNDQTIKSDPQLAVALVVLKGKMLMAGEPVKFDHETISATAKAVNSKEKSK